ncbi:MAG: cytochrome c1 [Alphaproteobacteria bacterium]|nr:cytochrome c1 [Alphaproteobacteria bacterium]
MRRLISAVALLLAFGTAAEAAEAVKPPKQHWSFSGIFGTFDRASLQRGFQVYKEGCAACHAVTQLSYRDLKGIGYQEDDIKAIAAQAKVMDGPNDAGEMFERVGRPSDKFVRPFPNENAARAGNNGAFPPDLSMIAKARVGGPDYVYGVLVGYVPPPAGVTVADGMHFNTYFPGQQIAMPAPLNVDGVPYQDGTKATVEQQAKDVTTFLTWASEPTLEARKQMGIKVLIFLIVFTGILYAAKRKVWASVH